MATPVHRKVEEARCVSVVGDVYRLMVTAEETGGTHSVVDAILGAGGGPPLHRHSREDETFVVLEGEVTFVVDGKEFTAGPGSSVFAPRGGAHRFANRTLRAARMLMFISPGGLERMFVETGTALASGSTEATPVDEAALARVKEAAGRYGVELMPG